MLVVRGVRAHTVAAWGTIHACLLPREAAATVATEASVVEAELVLVGGLVGAIVVGMTVWIACTSAVSTSLLLMARGLCLHSTLLCLLGLLSGGCLLSDLLLLACHERVWGRVAGAWSVAEA